MADYYYYFLILELARRRIHHMQILRAVGFESNDYNQIDPEYVVTQELTEKSDVYSYGVVLLEIVTARRAVQDGKNLVESAQVCMASESRLAELVDRSQMVLHNKYPVCIKLLHFKCKWRTLNFVPNMDQPQNQQKTCSQANHGLVKRTQVYLHVFDSVF